MDITTTKEFDKIINDKERKAVLIDFWAPWCGPCCKIAPLYDQMAKSFSNNSNIIFLTNSYFIMNSLYISILNF